MKVEKKTVGAVTIIGIVDEFDSSGLAALDEEVDALIESGVNQLVVNLRLLTFIDSTALGWLVKTAKRLRRMDGELVVSEPSTYFDKVIRAFGIDLILNIHATDEEAVARFA